MDLHPVQEAWLRPGPVSSKAQERHEVWGAATSVKVV